MNFSGILHNKLFLIGGGVVCFFVLLRLLKGSSQGTVSTATGTAAPTDAQVQAQTTLALAQIDSASKANETNASLAAQQVGFQEALAEKGMDVALAKYSIDAGSDIQRLQINQQAASDTMNMNLQASIAKWTLDSAAQQQANNNAFQLAYAANANASADHQAEVIAAVTRASIDANTNLGIASLQAQTAQVASYVGSQVAINESNNAKDVSVAQVQAGVAKHGQTMGLLGGIIGGIGGLFSDRRLKTDAVLLGVDADGIRRYAYRYIGDRSYQIGVMADEVPARAKGERIMGYDTVNYRLLAGA